MMRAGGRQRQVRYVDGSDVGRCSRLHPAAWQYCSAPIGFINLTDEMGFEPSTKNEKVEPQASQSVDPVKGSLGPLQSSPAAGRSSTHEHRCAGRRAASVGQRPAPHGSAPRAAGALHTRRPCARGRAHRQTGVTGSHSPLCGSSKPALPARSGWGPGAPAPSSSCLPAPSSSAVA